jgi:hypothetical protein
MLKSDILYVALIAIYAYVASVIFYPKDKMKEQGSKLLALSSICGPLFVYVLFNIPVFIINSIRSVYSFHDAVKQVIMIILLTIAIFMLYSYGYVIMSWVIVFLPILIKYCNRLLINMQII